MSRTELLSSHDYLVPMRRLYAALVLVDAADLSYELLGQGDELTMLDYPLVSQRVGEALGPERAIRFMQSVGPVDAPLVLRRITEGDVFYPGSVEAPKNSEGANIVCTGWILGTGSIRTTGSMIARSIKVDGRIEAAGHLSVVNSIACESLHAFAGQVRARGVDCSGEIAADVVVATRVSCGNLRVGSAWVDHLKAGGVDAELLAVTAAAEVGEARANRVNLGNGHFNFKRLLTPVLQLGSDDVKLHWDARHPRMRIYGSPLVVDRILRKCEPLPRPATSCASSSVRPMVSPEAQTPAHTLSG